MRSALVAVVLFVIGPRVALAFSGPEHRDLSNLALRAALASDAGSNEIRDEAERLLCEPACAGTFGELVAAVDGFSDPQQHLAIAKAWDAVRDRQKEPLFHLIALHRNSTHFQGEALTHYATNHANAIEVAKSNPVLALYREAVALHFLEDALSAGHILTPRRGMPNAVSGSLHDATNHSGAFVEFDDAAAWERILGLLKTIDPRPPGSSVLFAKDPPEMTLHATEVDALAKNLASVCRETFYGDALLNSSKASAQKVAMLALATQSLIDVLRASIEIPDRLVQACFTPRNVEVGKGFQNLSPFAGPTGAFVVGDSRPVAWDADHRRVVLPQCPPRSSAPAFIRYDVDRTPGFSEMLYHFPGYSVAAYFGIGTKSGARRIVIEGSRIFAASDPARGVMKKINGVVTNEPWRSRFGNVGASMNASFVRGSNYWGVGVMGEGRNSFFRKNGFTIGPRLGVRHYQGDRRTVQAFEYGGKMTAGTGVLDVTLVIDRGTSFRDDGSPDSEFIVAGGADITVSRGWLSLLGRRVGALFSRKR